MEYIELGAERQEKKFQNKATGLYTKDFFFETGKVLLQLAKRYEMPFMIAVIEVDNFKVLEEKYETKMSHELFKHTAQIVGEKFRTSDVVADMEDGHIGVIFYNTSNVNSKIALEALRRKIEQSKYILGEEAVNITVSIGAVVMHNLMGARTVEKLYEQAKIGLQGTRKKEKNYVVVD